MVIRSRSAALALAVAALGVTGCGASGSDVPPPAAAPAPVTAPASDHGQGQGQGGVAVDLDQQHAAIERSVRDWGRAASRVCRKSHRRLRPWVGRINSMRGAKPSRASVVRMGRIIARTAKAAEYEYDLLRAIALPKEADAVHEIYTFLEMEEENLMLLQRLGANAKELDIEAIALGVTRVLKLGDDYERAARAVHAGTCTDA